MNLEPSAPTEEKQMTFVDHIRDLRDCLRNAVLAVIVGMGLAWAFTEQVFDFIRKPIQPYLPQGGLVFTAPLDKFMAHIKIALVVGVIVSCPFWLYQVWRFISPALYKKEKRLATGFVFAGTVQFLLGASFCYFVVFPGAFQFLMAFGGDTDKPMITISQYLDFFTQMILVFGLTFEVPVVISFLGLIGLVSSRFLKEKRRYAIVINSIVAAVAAPPDVYSMFMLLIPLILMYEVSILVIAMFEKRKIEELKQQRL
jgi:sec-independent protein translocase protein TatC